MMKHLAGSFKRAAALVMSLFIILSQIALPVAALAQDLFALPSLSLSYPAGEGMQSVMVQPSLYASQPVYWATVPAEALQTGVTLEIMPTGAEGETYQSAFGNQLVAQDASAVDGTMVATYIEVYLNGALTGSYPLFLSTRGLPEEAPALQPAPVRVECYDQSGNLLQSWDEMIDPAGGREIAAPSMEGYTLVSAASVWVEMYADGSLSQSVVTFSYQNVIEPVRVAVEAYDQNNALIYTGEEWITAGKEFFAPELEGYTLTGAPSVWVDMDADGNASQSTVAFYYQKTLQAASVAVYGYDQNGQVIYTGEEWIEPAQGRDIFAPELEGYALSGNASVWVEMDGSGALNTSVVEFYYSRVYAAVPVAVSYLSTDGEWLGGYEDSVGKEGKTFYPEALEGYEAGTPESITVTMDDSGVLSQNTVEFYYAKLQPKTASITVKIVDSANWENVFFSDTKDYGEGSHVFTPDAAYLPADYALDSADGVTVNVYADGTADLYEVVFTATYHAPAPKTASITVKIVDSANWENVFFSDTKDYGEGSHVFTPDAAYLPADYALDSADGVTVNVYADGTADLYEVVFTATYHAPVQPEQPKTASITMKIVDSANWENVFFSDTKDYGEGSHVFTPDAAYLPADYALDSADGVTVNVYADGMADLYEVVFTATYHAPVQPEEPEAPEDPSSGLPEGVTLLETLDCEGETTVGGLRFRSAPDTSSSDNIVVKGVSKGVVVQVTCSVQNASGELWYGIVYDGQACYVKGDCLKLIAKEPVTAKVSFQYLDNDGNILMESFEEMLAEGSHATAVYFKEAPEGYTYSGVNADTVVVDANGANPAVVVFTYAVKPAVSVDFTMEYVCEGQPIIDAVIQPLGVGSYPVSDYVRTFEGYTYMGANQEILVVNEDGTSSATIVTFDYNRNPVTADVTIHHRLEDGSDVPGLTSETVNLGENTYSVQEFVKYAEGYSLLSASADSIVVDASGASPAEVTLTYQKVVVEAAVTVSVMDAENNAIPGMDSFTVTLGEGVHAVSLIQPAAPAGYAYSHASAEQITVTAGGADPSAITFYYNRLPVEAQVTVQVQDTNNQPIADSYPVTLGEGTHDAAALRPADPAGYAFSHASHTQVVVGANGADPAVITFHYQKLPTEAQVSFRYVDEQGNAVNGLDSYTATLAAGAYDTAVYAATAPAGYLYNGASAAQIVIDENGASPAEVFFYYTRLPEAVSVPVYHQDGNGQPLMDATVITFGMGDFGKTVNTLDLLTVTPPEGYVYAGVSSDTITIDQRGGVTPEAIHITYVVRPKAEADVTFHYLCEGKSIAESQTHRLSEGTWETNEYAVKAEGYQLVGVDAQSVTIGMDGTASPAVVTFSYEKLITTANLTVHYRNSFGEEMPGSPEIRPLEKGTHTITPNAAYAPAGYVLSANTQAYEVTVNSDLSLSVPSVSFNYYDQNLKGTVTVNYYDTESGATFATEQLQLAPGTHELSPNEALVKSKGNYEASDILTNTTVKVDEKGVAAPTAVVFYYKPAAYQGYQGYLLVTQQTAIRKEAAAGGAVMALLDRDTVLWSGFQYKSGATEWFDAQTQTGESFRGWVDGAHVRKITAEEARILIEEANQPKEPDQNPGYYITIMNNVPLRQHKNTASQAKYLNINTVVQVSAQEYDDAGDHLWHAATYYDYDNKVKYAGFIRDGQLRKLTQEETDEYLSANEPIQPENSVNPYDPNGPSTYGYVTKDSVNFRSEPGGTRLKMLNKYGMALITGTREVNGVIWYNVNYSGQVGWIHGDYFHQMTLSEFTSFMGSEAYYQGIANNTSTSSGSSVSGGSKPSGGSTGSATQGNVSSVEDWNVGVWQNTGVTNQTTYQPFNPYATPVPTTNPKGSYTVDADNVKFHQMASENSTAVTLPKGSEITIAGTVMANGKTWYQVTYDGRNGYVETTAVQDKLGATPTPAPTSTFVIGTMIPITYEDQATETQTGTVPWGLIGGAIVLVGGAGGVYAYALNQNKKRKAAAARAAASRRKAAAEAAAAAGATSPYARRAVAAPGTQRPVQSPYPGTQQAANPAQTRPASPYQQPQQPQTGSYAQPQQPQQTANPYARPAQAAPIVNPYAASAQAAKPAARETANPYARPVAPISQQASSQSAPSASEAPRRTRMQRYHEAGSDGDTGVQG